MEVAHLIGRIIFGGYFIYNAMNHLFLGREFMAGYAQAKGVSAPTGMVVFSGLLLLAGGLSMLLGVFPSWGIVILLVFLIPVSFRMHNFWSEEGEARMNDMINFMKNMALAAALLMFYAIPQPWPYSLG